MNQIETMEMMYRCALADQSRRFDDITLGTFDRGYREAIETVRAMQEALYKLEEAAQDSNDAQYGTLSTRFVLDLIQPALRRAEGNAG